LSIQRNTMIQHSSIKSMFFKREMILFYLLIIVNIFNAITSEYYLDVGGIMQATRVFLDKGFVVLGMTYVLMIGEIDISVASIIALCSCVMGVVYNAGLSLPIAMLICIGVGALCGLLNGILVAKFRELASMIITLATMSLYRGIAWILLGDKAAGGYPDWFTFLSSGDLFKIGGVGVPFILIVFIVFAVAFGVILRKGVFGKKLYMVGNNAETSQYSGIKVFNIRVIVFVIIGIMSSISAIFLTSRLATARPNVATNYEMEAIAIVILGGVKTDGGSGTVLGVVLSMFIVGLLKYGLGLNSICSEIILIVVGALLVLSILIPNMSQIIKQNTQIKKVIRSQKY